MIIKTNRPKPRVQILRGWDLVSTSTLHQVHRAKAGENIRSGMIISREWDATDGVYQWVKGCPASRTPFIAFQDDTEADVVAAQGLTGISLSGDYEIQTGYFTTGTYNADTALAVDNANPGNLKVAATGERIVGRVSRIRGAKQLNPSSPTALFYENSETTPANSTVIVFETATGVA